MNNLISEVTWKAIDERRNLKAQKERASTDE